ncbi:hypothetical protein BH24ACT14_BH24ACT14_14810 [soil metagenome]
MVPALVRAALEAGHALEAGQLVCGPSAAWLHGLLDHAPTTVWIRLSQGDRHSAPPGVLLRYGPAAATERVRRAGLPTTSIGLTIRDLAGLPEPAAGRRRRLLHVIATADALRLITIDALAAQVQAAHRFRGRPLLQRVLDELRGELSHSGAEARARRMVRDVVAASGLRLHPRPYAIRQGRRVVAEADLAVVALRYDIEVDGPHHLLPAQQAKDRHRDRRARAEGWTVDWFLVEEIDAHPEAFTRAIRATISALLARQSSSRGDHCSPRR